MLKRHNILKQYLKQCKYIYYIDYITLRLHLYISISRQKQIWFITHTVRTSWNYKNI